MAQLHQATIDVRAAALEFKPRTDREVFLLAALRQTEIYLQHAEQRAFELRASNILVEAEITDLELQLAMKKSKKLKNMDNVVGDGLTDNEAEGKVRRDAATKLFKEAKAKWAVADNARKEAAAEARAKNAKAKEVYERNKAKAKAAGKVFRGAAPTMLPIPKKIPEPRLRDFLAGIVEGDQKVFEDKDAGIREDLGDDGDEHNAADDS